jgi:hypothetical protein
MVTGKWHNRDRRPAKNGRQTFDRLGDEYAFACPRLSACFCLNKATFVGAPATGASRRWQTLTRLDGVDTNRLGKPHVTYGDADVPVAHVQMLDRAEAWAGAGPRTVDGGI